MDHWSPWSFDFGAFGQELEVCYLGRDIGSEKVAWLPAEDPRSQVRSQELNGVMGWDTKWWFNVGKP